MELTLAEGSSEDEAVSKEPCSDTARWTLSGDNSEDEAVCKASSRDTEGEAILLRVAEFGVSCHLSK